MGHIFINSICNFRPQHQFKMVYLIRHTKSLMLIGLLRRSWHGLLWFLWCFTFFAKTVCLRHTKCVSGKEIFYRSSWISNPCGPERFYRRSWINNTCGPERFYRSSWTSSPSGPVIFYRSSWISSPCRPEIYYRSSWISSPCRPEIFIGVQNFAWRIDFNIFWGSAA